MNKKMVDSFKIFKTFFHVFIHLHFEDIYSIPSHGNAYYDHQCCYNAAAEDVGND